MLYHNELDRKNIFGVESGFFVRWREKRKVNFVKLVFKVKDRSETDTNRRVN